MNKFLQDIKEPYWWIGVVIIGVVLHVLASYVRDWIDRGRLRVFSSLKARTEYRRKRIQEAAAIMRGSGFTRMYHLIRSVSFRLRGLVSLILSISLMIFGMHFPHTWVQFLLIFVGALLLLIAMRYDFTANEMEEAIQEAIRQETENKDEQQPRIATQPLNHTNADNR